MQSILSGIQDTVKKYAEVISQILKVDVEIMDSNFVRLAGTGEYQNSVNESMEKEGNVYKTVIESGKPLIINDPRNHPLCDSCPKKYTCLEKFEMCTPIQLNSQVIGVIGIICFSEDQKSYLLSNIEIYLTFLQQISDLISAKAYEKMERENILKRTSLLNEIINKIAHGVIVLDRHNYISHLNQAANSILNLSNLKSEKLNLIPTGNSFSDHDEYKLHLNNQEFLFIGKTYKANMNDDKYDSIFIFDEATTVNNFINRMTNLENNITLNSVLSASKKMAVLKERALQISNSTSTILITGESGTGKEMFARAIHKLSPRRDNPFIAINCGAIPESLLESELFGYVGGSFTGADPKGKIGKFELSNKGTIFLDEIGDMPLYMQVKLLRVLQEKEVVKIGASKPVKIDVRIIAATNKNLEEMIKENLFREDLYYRLNVIPFEVPPLKERIEDIKILTPFFANKYADLFSKKFTYINKDVWDILYGYNWPGNVRELENTVEFMVNIMNANGIITKDCVPKRILLTKDVPDKNTGLASKVLSLKELEKQVIINVLEKHGYTTEGKKLACSEMEIGIATLYRKMKEYKIL
jgi:sigma-54 dependent transcriptional regulator, acetoin dehydrogenase operon transcriptional activator AcoR